MNNKEFNKRITKLTTAMQNVKKNLKEKVNQAIITNEISNSFWSKLKSGTKQDYINAQVIFNQWIKGTLPVIYEETIKTELEKINNLFLVGGRKYRYNFQQFVGNELFQNSLEGIMDDAIASFFVGAESGEKTLMKFYALTKQVLLEEEMVNKAVAEGFAESGAITASTKKLQKELLEKSLNGQFIAVVGKDGINRLYDIKKYSELVARTKYINASSTAIVNTAITAGSDLVQVSSHNTTCKVCAPYEGKIYSLSGKNKDFPKSGLLPPYHPKCKHSITVVFEEALQLNKTYDDYSDFSKGKIKTHPTRKSFIPLSDRELN